jgi:indolepyruvate ferredoxin oxidoreductase
VYGPWIFPFLRLLAKGKRLRGTILDIFGHTKERRGERELIREYEAILAELMLRLNHDNHPMAVEIAEVPQSIRGFGSIKAKNIATARDEWKHMMALWRADSPLPKVAD